jgi:TM2 domain-containing membrane protein YozV
MECKNHAGMEADNICVECGKPICKQCAVELKNGIYCKECLENRMRNGPRKSKLLTFFLSLMPGVGHMYLGLINKGLTIMFLLFASLFLVILFSGEPSMAWFPGFFIPTLSIAFVSYSIFDSLDIADKINSGKSECFDSTLEASIIKQKFYENRKLIGCVFLILGVISAFNLTFGYLENIMRACLGISISLPGLMLALVFVVLGILLIRKSSR